MGGFRVLKSIEHLFEMFPDIVARHDRNHRYLYVNSAMKRISGIEPSNFIGKTFDQIGLPEEIWKPWCEKCNLVFETGQTVVFNTELQSPNGTIMLETTLIPEIDDNGNFDTILAVCRESPRLLKNLLHELENINEELLRQQKNAETIMQNIPMIISRFDKHLRHIYVNQASQLTGDVEPTQCLGKTWEDIGLVESQYMPLKKYFEDAFSTGNSVDFETLLPKSFGKISYFRVILIPEKDGTGTVQTVLSIAQDVTSKKKFEHELARLDKFNIIGEMAASLGHEIRNPLSTVRGYLQWFQTKKETIKFQDQFQLIIDELDRANGIITEYLSLAKNKVVELKMHNINLIIKSMLPLVEADALGFGHNIQLELDHISECLIDENELRQLIVNLSRNAFEAMAKGGTLLVKTYIKDNQIVLAISDTGPGMPPQILNNLGTPFITTKENGVGLGLAVCFRIAERHNAKIELSTSNTGTTVFVFFKI